MRDLTYNERIAVMRILLDIVLADGRFDAREQMLYNEIAKDLDLDQSFENDVQKQNSLLSLAVIHGFTQPQKEKFAKLMGRMIIVDEDINYNEVKIYNVVNDFCKIEVEFDMDNYPQYTRS